VIDFWLLDSKHFEFVTKFIIVLYSYPNTQCVLFIFWGQNYFNSYRWILGRVSEFIIRFWKSSANRLFSEEFLFLINFIRNFPWKSIILIAYFTKRRKYAKLFSSESQNTWTKVNFVTNNSAAAAGANLFWPLCTHCAKITLKNILYKLKF
jgi:hypothetical protein